MTTQQKRIIQIALEGAFADGAIHRQEENHIRRKGCAERLEAAQRKSTKDHLEFVEILWKDEAAQ